jgi:CrcB protein
MIYLLIALGGMLGANARFFLSNAVAARYGAAFPYGTFLINASGCFVMGLFLTVLGRHFHGDTNAKALVATGFLGGYTTFSTFTYETMALIRQGALRYAVANLLGSTLVGIAAAGLGIAVARAW